jgi:transposase-like protein
MSKKNRRNRLFSDEQLKQIINQYNITSIADVQNVVKELTHDILQTALNAEYDETMVYRRNDQNSREISENYRNGFYDKTVKTSFGELPLEIPRDRLNKHIPIIVPKHSSDISHIEDKIISLYARGMSTRDINDTVNEIYGINVDPTMVSKITDKLLPVINE